MLKHLTSYCCQCQDICAMPTFFGLLIMFVCYYGAITFLKILEEEREKLCKTINMYVKHKKTHARITSVLAVAIDPDPIVGIFNSFSLLLVLCSLCPQPALSWLVGFYLTGTPRHSFLGYLCSWWSCLYGVISDFHYLLLLEMANPGGVSHPWHTPPFSHSGAAILFTLDNQNS